MEIRAGLEANNSWGYLKELEEYIRDNNDQRTSTGTLSCQSSDGLGNADGDTI